MYYQAPVKSAHKKTLTKYVAFQNLFKLVSFSLILCILKQFLFFRIIQEASKKCPVVVEACLCDSLKKVTTLCTQNLTNEEIEKTVLHILCLIDNLTLGKYD